MSIFERHPLPCAVNADGCYWSHVADAFGERVPLSARETLRAITAAVNAEPELRAKIAELEALFQQTHGVHVSWVAEGNKASLYKASAEILEAGVAAERERVDGLRARIANLEAAARNTKVKEENALARWLGEAQDRVAVLEAALREAARALHSAAIAGGHRDYVGLAVFADDCAALADGKTGDENA